MTARNLIALGVLSAVSAAAGFFFYQSTQSAPTAAIQPDNNVPSIQTTQMQMRPVFSLNDIDGNNRSITEWDGQALVVNFWATWCAPCRREIPILIELQDELAERGIQFIGIAIDEPDAVSQYAVDTPFNYPVLVGEQQGIDAAEGFGADVVALPLTVFTDYDGRVIEIHAGEISRAEIKSVLKRLPRQAPKKPNRQQTGT